MTQRNGIAVDYPGVFLTFEGGEGGGKSTQVGLLADTLRCHGVDVVITREPGGSEGAEAIRALLVTGDPERWDAMTEVLLLLAARRDHLHRTILPALAAGQWVICDRFSDSTMAYQGYAHGMPLQDLVALAELAVHNFQPDMTFILDLPVDLGLQRAKSRGETGEDRFERMGQAFHQRLRDGFLSIAADNPQRCRVIKADQPIDDVHAEVMASLQQKWPNRFTVGVA